MTIQLRRDEQAEKASGGTVTFKAYARGRWVGWVGDQREWKGHRFGSRRWFACWREDGDEYARERVDGLTTRSAAVAWLTERTGGDVSETFGEWLRRQIDRQDPVGDLARDAQVPPIDRPATPYGMRAILARYQAMPEAYEALDQAEAEWRGVVGS